MAGQCAEIYSLQPLAKELSSQAEAVAFIRLDWPGMCTGAELIRLISVGTLSLTQSSASPLMFPSLFLKYYDKQLFHVEAHQSFRCIPVGYTGKGCELPSESRSLHACIPGGC